jgi:two-component system, NtrC family, response regulator GlrR
MIGVSEAFHAVERLIATVANYDVPVLIEGETGTGKELAARSVHYLGSRKDRPFIPVNCGSLADGLIESQLFGHKRGAFTSATEHQLGLVALAGSGTLFLDEIEALSAKGQVSLLRFLQDRHYRPLGGAHDELADVRILAATNCSLEKLVDSERFRIDLLYRLKLVHIKLPPLRDRAGDIEVLARHFLEIGAARFGCKYRGFSKETLCWFEEYTWPGNVRELEHVVYQGMLLGDGEELTIPRPATLPPPADLPGAALRDTYRRSKALAVSAFEQSYLVRLIEQTQGNISAAAKIAGTERRHLGRLLRKHGIRAVRRSA